MRKIVINVCTGGYGIKDEVSAKLGYSGSLDTSRTDQRLIAMIEAGEDVNSRSSDLQIVEVPDNVDYYIDNYDGSETLILKPIKSEVVRLAKAGDVNALVKYLEDCDVL
jgi:hypothetical protein